MKILGNPLLATTLVLGLATSAAAQTPGTLNTLGVTGLIDMPSGEAQKDGTISFTTAHFGSVSRNTLSFQISPRLSASFRYIGVRNFNDVVFSPFETYYDRSFDLRYQIFTEQGLRPAVTIGLQDAVGTGILSGEFIAATKHVTPRLKVTAGLGWGRLGSYGPIGQIFGDRPAIVIGSGGNVNFGQWFRGDVAPFAGIEWQVNEKLGLKLEYSSDAYDEEAGLRRTFNRNSPFNFGAEYQVSPALRFGAYYMYGSEIGLTAHVIIDPKSRPGGNVNDSAPVPVLPRPARVTSPEAWSHDWVTQPGVNETLRASVDSQVKADGIRVEALGAGAQVATVRVRNNRYDASSQVIGRVARAMSRSLPASVESFEIVIVANGVPASKVTVQRADLEALEFAPDGSTAIRDRVRFADQPRPPVALAYDPKAYPRFNWSVSPYLRTSLFDPQDPFRADVGLRLRASYDVTRGVRFNLSVTQKLFGNLDQSNRQSNSVLPRVRTNTNIYDREGETAVERLTANWYARPGKNLYSRVTVGYLERMFGGVSGEMLWAPVNSRLALGVELNYVQQRDFNGGFGFQDYDTFTGLASAYYELGKGYRAQLDVGQYLAGDIGATLSLDREFANGWRVGAFATKTNISSATFGEGSFDKGIRLVIPLGVTVGQPSRTKSNFTIRPVLRDGGAKLDVEGRLYESVRDYHSTRLDAQWGRFWK